MSLAKFIRTYTEICRHGIIGGGEGARCKTCARETADAASRSAGHAKCLHGVWGGEEARRCKECIKMLDYRAKKVAEFDALSDAQKAVLAEKGRIAQLSISTQSKELSRLREQYIPQMNQIYEMSAFQFEDFMAYIFEKKGYSVQKTSRTNDGGRDAIMKLNGKKYLLECKRYAAENSSGRPDIQKFHSAIISDKAEGGFFVTTGKFTDNAVNYASDKNLTLIDRSELKEFIGSAFKTIGGNGVYNCTCLVCGEIVPADIDNEVLLKCKNGHAVHPTLKKQDVIRSVFKHTNVKHCPKCASLMRKVKGPYGLFYGCTQYPKCDGKRK